MNKEFITPKNLNIIYETLIDCNFDNLQNILKDKNNLQRKNEINKLFMININYFYENEISKYDKNISLIDLNKTFIIFMLQKGKFEFPVSMSNQTQKSNTTIITEKNDRITSKDIQQFRLNEFENDLRIKKNEFVEGDHIHKPPPQPNFKDNYDDEPIKNIDLNVLISKRNAEIEEIVYNTTSFIQNEIQPETTNNTNNKHIKILDGDDNIIKTNSVFKIVELSETHKPTETRADINSISRHVSWEEPLYSSKNTFNSSDFLKKLKKSNDNNNNEEQRHVFGDEKGREEDYVRDYIQNKPNNIIFNFTEILPEDSSIGKQPNINYDTFYKTPEELTNINVDIQKKIDNITKAFDNINDRLDKLEIGINKLLNKI